MKQLLHKLIREDNFLSLAGNVLIALFGLGGFALLARILPMEAFGQWVLFLAGASFVEMFRFGISGNGLVRFLSGAGEGQAKKLIGANALIGFVLSLLLAVALWVASRLFGDAIAGSGFDLFFSYYPLLVLVNLPWNNAVAVLQARRAYGKILLIRGLNSGLFFLWIVIGSLFAELHLEGIVWALIAVNALSSLVSLLRKWDGALYMYGASVHSIRTLLDFGKYTTFTLIGTNLLRNADTFLISLSPLGAAAVALYSVPLKLTELQQIPLRSFAATAFPKMSKASISGDRPAVRSLFYTYSGALTLLFVLGSLLTFVFADLLVLLLSGAKYYGTDPVTGFNAADLVRVLAFYGLLLPIDRMTGIALDSINKPRVNALKVFLMAGLNIVGNLIALFVFQSLLGVAVVSLLFTAAGIWLGMYFLQRELGLGYKGIYTHGLRFYRDAWCGIRASVQEMRLNSSKESLR